MTIARRAPHVWPPQWVWAAVAVVLVARGIGLLHETGDTVEYVVPWFVQLSDKGFASFAAPLVDIHGNVRANYTPAYLYVLYVLSLARGVLPDLVLAKLATFPFEVLAAWTMFRIVLEVGGTRRAAWAAAVVTVALPTVIIGGAVWGQCDIIYTSFLLLALYYAIRNQPFHMMAAVGLSLAFKAQAVVFAPFLLVLFVRRRWSLHHAVVVPLAYFLVMVPAWLAGRPLMDLMTVYLDQVGTFRTLSLWAPNLYIALPNDFYRHIVILGVLTTTIATLALGAAAWRKKLELTNRTMVFLAVLSVSIVPFVLPKMHDRYFFAADVLSICLLFAIPRLWFVPLILQTASLAAYGPALLALEKTPPWLTQMSRDGVYVAAGMNTVLMGALVVESVRLLRKGRLPDEDPA